MSLPETSWQVRAPWPDEMDRLPDLLREPLARRGARRHWLWVLVTGELERIVAAVTLAERDPLRPDDRPSGRIDHAFLPAWSPPTEAVAALLDATLAQSRDLGLASLEGQASLDTPAAAWFTAQGFETRRAQELWRVSLDLNFARRHAAVERALVRRPVLVRPLDDAALPAVRALCAARGLLPANRVFLARAHQPGLDPRLSFVAGPPEAPFAVLLARISHGHPYLEVLARAPGAPTRGPEVGALLHAYFSAALRLGAQETRCLMAVTHAPETVRLLARAQAERLDRFAGFYRTLPA